MPSFPSAASPKVAILATGDEVVPARHRARPRSDRLLGRGGLAALIEARRRADELGIAQDTPESLVTLAGTAAPPTSSSPSAARRSASGIWSAPRFAPRAWSSTSGRSPCGRASPCSMAGSAPAGARRAGQPGLGADLRARVPGADAARLLGLRGGRTRGSRRCLRRRRRGQRPTRALHARGVDLAARGWWPLWRPRIAR